MMLVNCILVASTLATKNVHLIEYAGLRVEAKNKAVMVYSCMDRLPEGMTGYLINIQPRAPKTPPPTK